MTPPQRTAGATLDEVAERAGVSRATASRVLSGDPRVSDRAREAVRTAASALSYVPRQAARSLATRRSDALAFVVAESGDKFFADPFFAGVLRGAQVAAAERRRQLLFVVVANDDDRTRLEEYAAGGHVDGAMFLSVHGNDPLPGRVHRLGVPVVLAGRPANPRVGIPYVTADNVTGGRLAAQALLARGSLRPATVCGPCDMTASLDRLAGFRAELAENGIDLPSTAVTEGDFTISGGHRAMERLLESGERPDAVFAANDLMAVGALRALRARRIRVPDDVAVVGFDDVPLAADADPPLTTVRQPLEVMGRHMARMLMDLADGGQTTSATLAVELVTRTSA
ncbi:LacI family transcriptional regulator [Georgenia sp. 311]|uniref:LacI family transcriptional regulator n=1 Tax=Georgenia wutianyii TaxID=2585135 RepID=A0ABX5VLA3_9MICO|nr:MULTISPECIES: LacI family DNA-binding transcriptional regulator [Georgenia]QDB78561.1 LacI family transcriptional regulator [Georgenia wutianyii]TNC16853.1 LacI family transcriptional regulator [Georgenia sp. 311]